MHIPTIFPWFGHDIPGTQQFFIVLDIFSHTNSYTLGNKNKETISDH